MTTPSRGIRQRDQARLQYMAHMRQRGWGWRACAQLFGLDHANVRKRLIKYFALNGDAPVTKEVQLPMTEQFPCGSNCRNPRQCLLQDGCTLAHKPGEIINRVGDISMVEDGSAAMRGRVAVTRAQAKKAKPFGWKVVELAEGGLVVVER
jgi:hypothetical protein